MNKDAIKEMSLEEAFEAIDERLEMLSEDIPLEKSFELYKEKKKILQVMMNGSGDNDNI